MTNDKNGEKSLVTNKNNKIVKVGNSIAITNKILFADIEELFNRAFLIMNSKNKSLAKNKNYLLLFETDSKHLQNLEYSYQANRIEDYDTALGLFENILSRKPEHILSLVMKGNCKTRLKDFEGAIADYSKAIEIDSKFAKAYYGRGNAKDNLKDFEGAIPDYSKAIEIDPEYANAYNGRGVAKRNLKDFEGAIADYSKAIEIDPEYAAAYKNRGIAKRNLKDFEGAANDQSVYEKLSRI